MRFVKGRSSLPEVKNESPSAHDKEPDCARDALLYEPNSRLPNINSMERKHIASISALDSPD